ncbi:TPA: hypothetical protein H1005_00055 [archaeon]|uniref:Uncharacterized protein n=1 Tax=Candidatus Naiadarchaeum limnaeum TaxID=2756139 RepID=A0A832X5P7_9ARCH|nr:hypothetical protein [Candidatus Naiadarchaeales archaeon SRR2090153.bin1042]HIK00005.1 hypothetical protein [Candidatus Naiadarchaeum limnaeum]
MELARKFLEKVYSEELKFLKDMLDNSNYRDYLYVGPLSLESIIQKFEHMHNDIADEAKWDEMLIENIQFKDQSDLKKQIDYLEASIQAEMMQDIKLAYNAITEQLIFDGDDFIFTDYMQRARTIRDDSNYSTKETDLINFVLGKDEDASRLKELLQ